MKKSVFLCVLVSLAVFETAAKDLEPQEQFGLVDFVFGNSSKNTKPDEQRSRKETKRYQADNYQKEEHESINQPESYFPDQFSFSSDKVVEPHIPNEKKKENECIFKVDDNTEIDEELFHSFKNISHVSDFLKKIQINVECLSSGKMSNSDWNKLVQKKQKISSMTQQCIDSIMAYDKICAIEKVVMDYNSVSEISVNFLSDIGRTEINQVQNSLFLSEVDLLSNKLAHAFSTPVGNDLKNSIEKLHEEIDDFEIKKFYEKLLFEIKKIPNELVESNQKEKIDQVLQKIDQMQRGVSKNKYITLQDILKSYNDLKVVPFKLKKISSNDVKNLLLEMTEDLFFEKMLNSLKAMSEESYSPLSENDAEVVAALNIKKAICKMLGGKSYSGMKYNSNIKQFRATDSLEQKQSLLKDTISQFNKTVNLFKTAVKALKEEGRSLKNLNNIDSIHTIDEDVDKIFEKIAIYSGNLNNEVAINRTAESYSKEPTIATVDENIVDSAIDLSEVKIEENGELI